jgi:hypothetical protein
MVRDSDIDSLTADAAQVTAANSPVGAASEPRTAAAQAFLRAEHGERRGYFRDLFLAIEAEAAQPPTASEPTPAAADLRAALLATLENERFDLQYSREVSRLVEAVMDHLEAAQPAAPSVAPDLRWDGNLNEHGRMECVSCNSSVLPENWTNHIVGEQHKRKARRRMGEPPSVAPDHEVKTCPVCHEYLQHFLSLG